ncbi:hypothetical protein CR513_11826, partial [Mucuna pruriens]
MQLKRRSASRRSTASSSSWRGRDKEKVRSDRSLKKGSGPFQVHKEMTVTLTPMTSASQCPNKRAMILSDNSEIESDSSCGDTSTSRDLLMVKRLIGSQVIEEAETQRENIFHSKCHVLGNLHSVIIDGGSCVNVVSERLVSKLALPTIIHPRPYRL